MTCHSMRLLGGVTLVLVAGMLLCCDAARAPGAPPRSLLQAANCTSVQRCGSNCKPCKGVKNGTPVCRKRGTSYACSVQCRAGFVLKTAGGAFSCSRSTGLTYGGQFLKASRNQTQKSYKDWLAVGDAIKQLGVTTVEKLASVACNSSSITPDCLDALLMAVLPSRYNSNRTTDTGGYAFISPAQNQGDCAACVGFAATAALEAAVNVYKQQSWSKLSLSEQDFNFCEMYPPVDCSSGSTFDQLVKRVMDGKITKLASRSCYPYLYAPTGDCDNLHCASQLPEGGFTMTYKGGALGTLARVKAAIVMQGGALTAMDNLPGFGDYPGTPAKLLYNQDAPAGSEPEWHAVFCYGFADSAATPGAGYWICKNSWGTSWGLGGTFRIAYGAAYVMPPDYSYALQFGPVSDRERLEAATKALQHGTIHYISTNNTDCVWYRTVKPMRLLALHELISTIAVFGPSPDHNTGTPSKVHILGDLLLSNLGYVAEPAALNTTLRVCGEAKKLLATVVPYSDADPQLEALLQIKEAVDKTGVLRQWNRASGAEYCKWPAILCAESKVVTLVFFDDVTPGLQGTLPPTNALKGLAALQAVFFVSQPGIAGTLPSDWAQLHQVDTALVMGTNVHGTIPASWGNWTSLQRLLLSGNTRLTGPIPKSFGRLTALEVLDMSSNSLTGSIPATIGSLSNLSSLDLQDNKLGGRLPDAMGALVALQVLNLNNNLLTGSVPASLGDLKSLTTLALGGNWLTLYIPDSLGTLAAVRIMDLGSNALFGTIPVSFQGLSTLRTLDLSANLLSGSLPEAVGALTTLEVLDLAFNELTGTVPASLGNLQHLTKLQLAANALTGTIPTSLHGLLSIQQLSLARNQLNGTLPAWLGDLKSLTELILHTNHFTGIIPETFGNLGQLTSLEVAYNKLQGPLPDALRVLEALKSIIVGGNLLTGSVPSSWSSMRNLSIAAFFNNTGMYGCLPASWESQSEYFSDKPLLLKWALTGTNITGFCLS